MAIIDDIQNSERLLDLSNQLIDSINERKKLLKGINAEEQLFFATVKQQQKLSQDITANAEKYLGYQIKSKDLAKQINAVENNALKSSKSFTESINGQLSLEQKLINQRRQSLNEAFSLRKKEVNIKKQISTLDLANDSLIQQRNRLLSQGKSINSSEVQNLQQQIKENQILLKIKEGQVRNFQAEGQKQKDIAKSTYEIIKNAKESEISQRKEIAFLKENLRIRKQIEKSTGLLGGIAKAASKIPGIGQYLNADEAIDEMEKLAAKIEESGGKSTSFGNRMQIAGKGLSVLAKGAYDNLKSPEAVFTFFLKAALTANDESVKLGKSLAYGADRANAFRENLVGIESASSNINVTTKNLVEAFSELATATGFAYEFSADQLKTQILLTKQVGLTADEAAQIQRFGVLTGKTSEETYKSFVKGLVATRNQLKVGINFKATLAEAVKVSGALSSSFQNNPGRIAAAVVQAKALGTSLEQTAKQGESLLNFESSIENELKAELLTGKQLNLERARAAALAGDQVTLAEELVKNVGSIEEFDRMNILQKKALAEAVGLTTDELATQLQKQKQAQESGKSLAQINEEEALKALERQNIQDKFNQSILKLQSLIGNLLAGPLGTMLDILVETLNVANLLVQPFTLLANFIKESTAASLTFLGVLGLIYAVKNKIYLKDLAISAIEKFKTLYNTTQIGQLGIIESIKSKGFFKTLAEAAMVAFKSVAAIPFVGPVLGAAAAASAVGLGMSLFSKGDDIMSEGGYGKRTLLSPEGAIKLNDKDTVIAGTNLGGGGNDNINQSIDLTPMISAINEVRSAIDRLYSKDTSVNMDGKKVGSTLTQGSYKVA